jgi:hypothetical protein
MTKQKSRTYTFNLLTQEDGNKYTKEVETALEQFYINMRCIPFVNPSTVFGFVLELNKRVFEKMKDQMDDCIEYHD